MRKTASVIAVACILSLATPSSAEDRGKRGRPPRPAEKPPEYGCVFKDLNTEPGVVKDGERIHAFVLKYSCREKTRPVDIEVWNERPPAEKELVKVTTDVVLEKGDHVLRLGGGGLAHGGRYITVLKADVPGGKKEIHRHVDTAVCKGWHIEYVEKHLNVSGCEIHFDTDPRPFKPGERIHKFTLKTNCKKVHKNTDIKVHWKPRTGDSMELVKIATDVTIPAGENKIELLGGGVGRDGYYVLEIPGITLGSYHKTVCDGWTLSQKP